MMEYDEILAKFPEPLARPLARAFASGAEPTARYGSVLDAFESVLRFLTLTLLAEHLALARSDAPPHASLRTLLLKGRLSTGDWLHLATSCAGLLRPHEGRLVAPELVEALLSRGPGRTSVPTLLEELCHARNRHWAHPATPREASGYARRLGVELPRLTALLEGLRGLGAILLCVPTRIENGVVVEVLALRGPGPGSILDVQVALRSRRSGPETIQLGRSALLLRASGELGVLFPFMRWVEAPDAHARGLYTLQEWRWARRRDRPRVKSLLYVGGAEDRPEPDRAMREVVEAALLPTIGGDMALDAIRGLEEEDPDHSIPSVWAEQADAVARAVGRESMLAKLEALVGRAEGGLIVIEGGPGSGKSWFSHQLHAHLQRNASPLLHLVKASRSPRNVLRALLHQCGEALGRPLGEASYRADRVEDLRIMLEQQMMRVATTLAVPCVAIVDGLDELIQPGEDWHAALEWLPRVFPRGVFVVATCRPDEHLLHTLRALGGSAFLASIALPPLERAVLDQFVAAHAGELGPRLGEVLDLQAAYQRSAGHPLHLRVLVTEAHRELEAAAAEGRPPRQVALGGGTPSERQIAESMWAAASAAGATDPGAAGLRPALLELLALAGSKGISLPVLRAAAERRFGRRLPLDQVTEAIAGMTAFLRVPSAGRYVPFHVSLSDYVSTVRMGEPERRSRHRELALSLLEGGRSLDEDYWAYHLTEHCSAGDVELSVQCTLAEDQDLLAARAARGIGVEHGAWLRRLLDAAPAESVQAIVAALERAWAPGGLPLEALLLDQQEEVAEALEAAGVPRLAAVAADIYQQLHSATGDAAFLRRKAWVSYQLLDRWHDAEEALRGCIAVLEQRDPVEAARARRTLASVAFDSGSDTTDAEALLQHCLVDFSSPGLDRELALTHEALGVVVDAEGRWTDAEQHYLQADRVHRLQRDAAAAGRVALNRSIAALFTIGVGPALRHLAAAEEAASAGGGIQLRSYAHANRSLLTLLTGDLPGFDALQSRLRLHERWLAMTVAESTAVRRWLGGDAAGASGDLARLAIEFDALDDAWGALDNRINLALLHLHQGRRELALEGLCENLAASRALQYPVGAAVAAHGLRMGGAPVADAQDDLAFYDRHLARLFRRTASPFVPCYVLLLP